MPENNPTQRKPDNIIIREYSGTIYTIEEYFEGKRTLEEIVAQRITQETNNDKLYPSISTPDNG